MQTRTLPALAAIALAGTLSAGAARAADPQSPETYQVRFDTTAGPFVVEVQRQLAPLAADRFYRLVKEGYYDDMRVFRVTGIFSTKRATVPINRILDVTVERPLLGRWPLSYGHMTFESAAQEQGVRHIRYIADVDLIDRAIQKVVQDAGLRGRRPDQRGSAAEQQRMIDQQHFTNGG